MYVACACHTNDVTYELHDVEFFVDSMRMSIVSRIKSHAPFAIKTAIASEITASAAYQRVRG